MDFTQLIQTQSPARTLERPADHASRPASDEPGSFRAMMRAGLQAAQTDKHSEKPAEKSGQTQCHSAQADKASEARPSGPDKALQADPAADETAAAEAGTEAASTIDSISQEAPDSETQIVAKTEVDDADSETEASDDADVAAPVPQPATSLLEALFIQALPQPPAEVQAADAAVDAVAEATSVQTAESDAMSGSSNSESPAPSTGQTEQPQVQLPEVAVAQATDAATSVQVDVQASESTAASAPGPALDKLPAQASDRARQALAQAPGQARTQQPERASAPQAAQPPAPDQAQAQAEETEATQPEAADSAQSARQAAASRVQAGQNAGEARLALARASAEAIDSLVAGMKPVQAMQPKQAEPIAQSPAGTNSTLTTSGLGPDDGADAQAAPVGEAGVQIGLDQARPDLGYGRQGERLPETQATTASRAAAPAANNDRFALIRQLSERIQILHSSRQRAIELSLEPASLGKIQLRLQQQAQAFHLRVLTELPLAKDLIESQIGSLRQHLQAQGIELAQVQIEVHPDPQQFAGGQGRGDSGQDGPRRRGRGFSLDAVGDVAESSETTQTIQTPDGLAVNTLV